MASNVLLLLLLLLLGFLVTVHNLVPPPGDQSTPQLDLDHRGHVSGGSQENMLVDLLRSLEQVDLQDRRREGCCTLLRRLCGHAAPKGGIGPHRPPNTRCMKKQLSFILPRSTLMKHIRSQFYIGLEFYFLCPGPMVAEAFNNTIPSRVLDLIDLFKNATNFPELRARYHMQEKGVGQWSKSDQIQFWSAIMVGSEMDNIRAIDRLVVAMSPATMPIGSSTNKKKSKSLLDKLRKLLLHYGTLKTCYRQIESNNLGD